MIDWVTFRVPCPVDNPLDGGVVLSVDREGIVEKRTPRWLSLRGSHESSLAVRNLGTFLEVSGNPVKWRQGHNLWGTNELQGLVYETVVGVCEAVGIVPQGVDWGDWLDSWRLGGFTVLYRVDATAMVDMGTVEDVRSAIRTLGSNAQGKHGGSIFRGETLYLNDNSRYWKLKVYGKGDEIESRKKGHRLPAEIEFREELMDWARSKLRVELQLMSMGLDAADLRFAWSWSSSTVMEQLVSKLGEVHMSTQLELADEVVHALPRSVGTVYLLWKAGEDLRARYSKSAFYRYRGELLKVGVDIASRCPDAPDRTNVVPFLRVLEMHVAEVPEWAKGTSLYYEPAPIASSRLKAV